MYSSLHDGKLESTGVKPGKLINKVVDANGASRGMFISPRADRRSFVQVARKSVFILFILLNDLSLEELVNGRVQRPRALLCKRVEGAGVWQVGPTCVRA